VEILTKLSHTKNKFAQLFETRCRENDMKLVKSHVILTSVNIFHTPDSQFME